MTYDTFGYFSGNLYLVGNRLNVIKREYGDYEFVIFAFVNVWSSRIIGSSFFILTVSLEFIVGTLYNLVIARVFNFNVEIVSSRA